MQGDKTDDEEHPPLSRVESSLADYEEFAELFNAVANKPRTSVFRERDVSLEDSEYDKQSEPTGTVSDKGDSEDSGSDQQELSLVPSSQETSFRRILRRKKSPKQNADEEKASGDVEAESDKEKEEPPPAKMFKPYKKISASTLAKVLRKREFLSSFFYCLRMAFAMGLAVLVFVLTQPPATSLPAVMVPIFAYDRMGRSVGTVTRKVSGGVLGIAVALVLTTLYYTTVSLFFSGNYGGYYALNFTTGVSKLLPYEKNCTRLDPVPLEANGTELVPRTVNITMSLLMQAREEALMRVHANQPLYSLVSMFYLVGLCFFVYSARIGIDVKFVSSSIIVIATMGHSTLEEMMAKIAHVVPPGQELLTDWTKCVEVGNTTMIEVRGATMSMILKSLTLSLGSSSGTMLGFLCAATAVMLPWPRLASTEVFNDTLMAGEICSMLFDTLLKDLCGAPSKAEREKEKGEKDLNMSEREREKLHRERRRRTHLRRMVEAAILKSSMIRCIERAKQYIDDMKWESWIRINSAEEKEILSKALEAMDLVIPFLEGMMITAKRIAYVSYRKSKKNKSKKDDKETLRKRRTFAAVSLSQQHGLDGRKRRPFDEPLDVVPVPWQNEAGHRRIIAFVEPVLRFISRDCRSMLSGFGKSRHKKMISRPFARWIKGVRPKHYLSWDAFTKDLIERYENSSEIVAELMQMNERMGKTERSDSSAERIQDDRRSMLQRGRSADAYTFPRTTRHHVHDDRLNRPVDFVDEGEHERVVYSPSASPTALKGGSGRISPTEVHAPLRAKAWEAETVLDVRAAHVHAQAVGGGGDLTATSAFSGTFPFNDVLKRSLFLFDVLQYAFVIYNHLLPPPKKSKKSTKEKKGVQTSSSKNHDAVTASQPVAVEEVEVVDRHHPTGHATETETEPETDKEVHDKRPLMRQRTLGTSMTPPRKKAKSNTSTVATTLSTAEDPSGTFILPGSWSNLFSYLRRDIVTAVRVSVALLIASIFVVLPPLRESLRYPMWVPLLANFLAFESVGATFQTSIDRILGVAVGTAVAYGTVVFQNVFNVPREVFLVVFIFINTFGQGGTSQLSRMSDYAAVMAIIVMLLPLNLAPSACSVATAKGEVSMFISERIGATFISTAIILVVWNTLWPRRASRILKDDFRACLYEASAYIERGVSRLRRHDKIPTHSGLSVLHYSTQSRGRALLKRVIALYALCDEAQLEPTLWRAPFPHSRYKTALKSLQQVVGTSILLNNCLESTLLDRRNFFLRRAGLLDHLSRLTALMAGTIFYSSYLRKPREKAIQEKKQEEEALKLYDSFEDAEEEAKKKDAEALEAADGQATLATMREGEALQVEDLNVELSPTFPDSQILGGIDEEVKGSTRQEQVKESERARPRDEKGTEKASIKGSRRAQQKIWSPGHFRRLFQKTAKRSMLALKRFWTEGYSSGDVLPLRAPPTIPAPRPLLPGGSSGGLGKESLEESKQGSKKSGSGGMKRATSYEKLKNAVKTHFRKLSRGSLSTRSVPQGSRDSVRGRPAIGPAVGPASHRFQHHRKGSAVKQQTGPVRVNLHEDVMREIADLEATFRLVCESLPRLVEQGAAFRPPSVKEMIAFNALFAQIRNLSDDVTVLAKAMDELQEAEIFTSMA